MAGVLIPCGEAVPNERSALKRLATLLGPEWAILSNVPGSLAGREIDALLVGPRAIVVCELKYYNGALEARKTGAWRRDGAPIIDPIKNTEATNFLDQADTAGKET